MCAYLNKVHTADLFIARLSRYDLATGCSGCQSQKFNSFYIFSLYSTLLPRKSQRVRRKLEAARVLCRPINTSIQAVSV